jgi:hypothetical protein
MMRGTPSRGTKKCRKFTALVKTIEAMSVISATLSGRYCAVSHDRNGSAGFVGRSTAVQ